MDSYSGDYIANNRKGDVTCKIEEPLQKYRQLR